MLQFWLQAMAEVMAVMAQWLGVVVQHAMDDIGLIDQLMSDYTAETGDFAPDEMWSQRQAAVSLLAEARLLLAEVASAARS